MRMRITRNLLIIFLVFISIEKVFGTHFRGGTFYWAPVSKIPSAVINISIIQRYSWVRSVEFCDSTTIATQSLISTNTTTLTCSKFYFVKNILKSSL
jgi:hypothetical protein